jgi:predicted ArsR family transcriptional regulator
MSNEMQDDRAEHRADDGWADQAIGAVAALGDPVRRRLYRFVGAQDHAVGRDEAAEGVGVSRSAAAFHLDRLVDDGLLEAEFRRLTGRRGPGAGRPAKLYRRAAQEISVSLPARRYQLAAGLLAEAVSQSTATGEPVNVVLHRVARAHGARLAGSVERSTAAGALAGEGYEPRVVGCEIVLANCPFSGIMAEHPELVCRMNLALLEGFAGALASGAAARLQPASDACCVRLRLGPPEPTA